jgi:hypothetical protein
MKQIKQILLYVALIFVAVGCKTNNGDIGVYYGSWALDAVSIDGTADTEWCADGRWTTWSFQNDVICISRMNEYADLESCWGTWSEDGNRLLLDYRHHDDKYADGTVQYAAPTWIYFVRNQVTELSIDSQTSKAMTLSTVDSQGRKITYTLRKTY